MKEQNTGNEQVKYFIALNSQPHMASVEINQGIQERHISRGDIISVDYNEHLDNYVVFYWGSE